MRRRSRPRSGQSGAKTDLVGWVAAVMIFIGAALCLAALLNV
ncbi:hypothetical protein [Pararhizobium mangrovi]|nr:hypothetical protein [Pararhizobium mangrovi]